MKSIPSILNMFANASLLLWFHMMSVLQQFILEIANILVSVLFCRNEIIAPTNVILCTEIQSIVTRIMYFSSYLIYFDASRALLESGPTKDLKQV